MVFKLLHVFSKSKWILLLMPILAFLLLTTACSTKKNTWTRRTYHNITSKYNVYWNGNESLKQGKADLRKNVLDDYSKVLRVYNYGKKSNAQQIYQAMDRAIQKGSIGVQRHSMKFGNKEYVRWIDDSYLMMGKAHFLKQDYISAKRTFDFVASQYNDNEIAQTANLWLARTYIQLEQFEKAGPLLSALEARSRDREMPREVSRELDMVLADFYIANKKFDQALPYLRRGILATNDRLLKTRAMFIMGQIYQRDGELSKALEQFNSVIKRNPPYEMAFEARLNLAKAYDSSQGDSKQIVKVLMKMLKDEKNEDYKDKIYYALAEVALKDNDEPLAIDYLKKSVAFSTNNKTQQATSALKLAGILFSKNQYVPAEAYYDTAVSALPNDYPGYDSITNRAGVLKDLVKNLVIVQTQDSLLRLATMDSVSRNQVIDRIISDYVAEEQRKKEEERLQEQMAMMPGQKQQGNTMETSSEWYFYNPNTLSFGYTEFLRKWGRRRLEDNWRISDKQSLKLADEALDLTATNESEAADTLAVEMDPRQRAYYLQDLPLTEEKQVAANQEIEEALNNLGYIYMERLSDNPKSIESYLSLNDRYPENEYRLQSWYALYKLFLLTGDAEQAAFYKNLIITTFPDSDYAQVLLDPDYFIKKAAQQSESAAFYERTYEAYQSGQYFRVKLNADRARSLYASDTALMPRFEFLRAVAAGRLEVIDSMAVNLDYLIKKWPQSGVTPLASSILRDINKTYDLQMDVPPDPNADSTAAAEKPSPYTMNQAAPHMVMIVCKTEKLRVDPLKVRLSDFNQRDFSGTKLMIKSLILDNERTLITVGNFDNLDAAKDYYSFVMGSEYVFGGISRNDYWLYPISIANYPVFYKDKDIDLYDKFWQKNNPKQ